VEKTRKDQKLTS